MIFAESVSRQNKAKLQGKKVHTEQSLKDEEASQAVKDHPKKLPPGKNNGKERDALKKRTFSVLHF